MTVAPEHFFWNAVIQAVIALPWADEPSELIEPLAQSPLLVAVAALPPPDVLELLLEPLDEQAASDTAPATRPATTPAR